MSKTCDKVHSFEPNPIVRQSLQNKILLNNINNITVHGSGLGTQDNSLPFFAPQGYNLGTGSFIDGFSDKNDKKPILLKVVNGDNYILHLKLTRIDLIKIDVEGFEKYVLAGLKNTLNQYRPMIAMEYSSNGQNCIAGYKELMTLLPIGYKIKKISCNKPYAIFFNSLSCVLENFDFQTSGENLLLYPQEISPI